MANKRPFLIILLLTGSLIGLLLLPAFIAAASPRTERVHTANADEAFTLGWFTEGDTVGDEVGYAVGFAGDINGDPYADVIIGAPHDTHTVDREGVAYIHFGTPGGPENVPAWTVGGGKAGSYFGGAVGTAGDVNGDHYIDVIVGAKDYNNGTTKAGGVFVFYGSFFGLSETADWELVGSQKDSYLGVSVGTAGDVNADTYDDVIVGASQYANGQTSEGQVQVFFGATTGLTTTRVFTFESNQVGALFGASVSTAGDVNCDGRDDVIVGAPQYDHGEIDEGAAFVFYGATDGISTTYTILDSDQTGAEFGTAVSTAGDVNGDGCDDVIVGAPLYDDALVDVGAAFVFFGSPSGVQTAPFRVITGPATGTQFGAAVGSAGDINRDGYDEVIVGAPSYTGDQSLEGAAFVYLGSASGLSVSPIWHGEGNKADTRFGFAVGSAGDVTGDQRVDLIVGAPQYRNNTDIRGRAFVYFGTGNVTNLDHYIYIPLVLRSAVNVSQYGGYDE